MYIGPWQEYRLAKIQGDAIQRLRQEWEDQIRGQLLETDDTRLRELMDPLVAKLPSLLLAGKSRSTTSTAVRYARSSGTRSVVNSEVSSRCSSRPESAQSTVSIASSRSSRTVYHGAAKAEDISHRRVKPGCTGNQETHDEAVCKPAMKPPRPTKKKGKKAPQLTALEQVQKRKKMFATWIKHAGNGPDDEKDQNVAAISVENAPETDSCRRTPDAKTTRLPLISSAVPANPSTLVCAAPDTRISSLVPLALPRLKQANGLSDEPLSSQVSTAISFQVSPTADNNDIDLDESVNEEDVNNLLNWTDTLLSPHAMDSLCDFGA